MLGDDRGGGAVRVVRVDAHLLCLQYLVAADELDVDPAAEERGLRVQRELLLGARRQFGFDAVAGLGLGWSADAQLAADGGSVVGDRDVDGGPCAGPDVAAQERCGLDDQVRVERGDGCGEVPGEGLCARAGAALSSTNRNAAMPASRRPGIRDGRARLCILPQVTRSVWSSPAASLPVQTR